MLVRFLKNWTLPLAMLSGTLGYFILANVPFLAPTKPYINDLIAYITPLLIFAQLLLTFCKVEKLNELKPKKHGMAGCCCFRQFHVWQLPLCWYAVRWMKYIGKYLRGQWFV